MDKLKIKQKCEPSSEFSFILRGLPRFRLASGVAGVINDEPVSFWDVPDAVLHDGIVEICELVVLCVCVEGEGFYVCLVICSMDAIIHTNTHTKQKSLK